jgi:Asp-tRNA(Asn)/Glu-tRNA(Gln) amidotransferase A subunit family amidase
MAARHSEDTRTASGQEVNDPARTSLMSTPPASYPRLFPEPDQTIAGISRALREGSISCAEILEQCLAQADEWEPKVQAWVVIDRERALKQARSLDSELKSGHDRGPLHGIPIGIKDIIDVAGLPTACGAKRWANRVADSDAKVVANLREAGAVILGKTVTTPYAWIDPPVTRNPWNLERTPGGSSSGSAAAVACGMCFGAIGTQTGGSITRPASFCGVTGLKPSKWNPDQSVFDGVKPFSPSLDHVGPIARTIEDLRSLYLGMLTPDARVEGAIAPFLDDPPRIGRLRGFFDRKADPAVLLMLEEAARVLKSAGARLSDQDDPLNFEEIIRDHRTIMAVEASIIHAEDANKFSDDYPPRIRELIDEGLASGDPSRLDIRDRMMRFLEGRPAGPLEFLETQNRRYVALNATLKALGESGSHVWITPATVGTAPDPSTTGDPSFNSPWSYTGLPTASLPIGLSPDGMPIAVQLVGNVLGDFELLRVAIWCEQAIRNARQ